MTDHNARFQTGYENALNEAPPTHRQIIVDGVGEQMIMVDVECLGTRPDSALAAIAATVFIPDTGEIIAEFYQKIDLQTAVEAGGVLRADTVKWWLKQPTNAQLEIVGDAGRDHNVYTITQVLENLVAFIQANQARPGKIKIWANGAGFDPVILEEAFIRLSKRTPWSFWKVLDVRTLVELGRQIGLDPKTDAIVMGTPHKAQEDCALQIGYVSMLWQAILAPHTRNYAHPKRDVR